MDHRSDIFSFGCALYEILTGCQTFEAETTMEQIASALKQEPGLSLIPPNVEPRVVELPGHCLAKDPNRRWQVGRDVRIEIETILGSLGVS